MGRFSDDDGKWHFTASASGVVYSEKELALMCALIGPVHVAPLAALPPTKLLMSICANVCAAVSGSTGRRVDVIVTDDGRDFSVYVRSLNLS